MKAAINFEKSTSNTTNFQNRILEEYSGMVALGRHEDMMGQHRSSQTQSVVDVASGDQFCIAKVILEMGVSGKETPILQNELSILLIFFEKRHQIDRFL